MGAFQSHEFSPCLDLNLCHSRYERKKRINSTVSRSGVEQEKSETKSAERLASHCNPGVSGKQATNALKKTNIATQIKAQNRNPSFKDPEPIQGWTIDEQQILIKELRKNPKAPRSAKSMKDIYSAVQNSMPEKSRHEIEDCYRHLQMNRIVYFCSPIK
jgi:hypothetical protein